MWKSSRSVRTQKQQKLYVRVFVLTFLLILFGELVFIFNIFSTASYLSPLPTAVQFGKKNKDNTEMLKEELHKANLSPVSIEVASQSSYFITLSGGEYIYFSQNKNISSQVASLQAVLSRLTIEGKRVQSLDFRYDKPIAVFKE